MRKPCRRSTLSWQGSNALQATTKRRPAMQICRLSLKWHLPLDRGVHVALAQKRNFRRRRRAGNHLPATAQRPSPASGTERSAVQLGSLLAIKSQGPRPLTIPERLFRQAEGRAARGLIFVCLSEYEKTLAFTAPKRPLLERGRHGVSRDGGLLYPNGASESRLPLFVYGDTATLSQRLAP